MSFQLFVVPSHEVNADSDKTVDSFKSIPSCVTICNNWCKINDLAPNYKWFGIFYDNEAVDWNLRSSIAGFVNDLPTLGKYVRIQAVRLFKKNEGLKVVSFSGTLRLFNRSIFIGSEFGPLCREDSLYEEQLFGGFILEHAFCIRPSTGKAVE